MLKDLIDKAGKKADAEDMKEPPEKPGEAPDAEDQSEPPENDATDEGAEPAAGEPTSEEGSNVSPEEQQIYDTVVIAANSIIYGDESAKVVLQKLEAEQGSPKIIGHTAAMIALSIQGGAEKQGKQIPPDVLFAAGQEIVANLVELCIAKGLVKEADEQEVFKQSVFEGLKAFGDYEKNSGAITPEVQQQARAELEQTVAAGKQAQPPGGHGGAVARAMDKTSGEE
jgi:hypothetical protein